jgi:hypothetical protein
MRRSDMKRCALFVAVAVLFVYLAAPVFAAGHEDDLQVIKKAVKGGHACEPGRAVKWFKVLITDNKSGTDIVKVTLPISMAKLFARCAKDKHLHMDKADIDVAAALKDLREMGPMTLIEIVDDDATVKIWLE